MGIYVLVPNADFSEVSLGKVSAVDGFQINAVSANPNLGTVTGSGVYEPGQQITVKATPLQGNVFSCWGDNYNIPSERNIVVSESSANYNAYFNTDQGYIANLLSDGTFEANIDAFATSTLKREISGDIIKIKYGTFFGNPTPGDAQIKIGEYDANGNWIQRQNTNISPDGGYVEFTPNAETKSIFVCVQCNIGTQSVTQKENTALVYDSLIIEEGLLNKEDIGSFMYSKLENYV